ncbi:MAG: alpha/beta fold hydrolase [Syntrophobacteraceae bacterium]
MPGNLTDKVHLRRALLRTGIALHYAEMHEDAHDPVVFLHGFADSWKSFLLVFPLLSEKWRILAPDLRGHGESDKPEGRYNIEIFAEDLLAFVDALGLEKANIVGHSMGSFVGQLFASRFPDRVGRLILIGSASSTTDNANLRELKRFIDSLVAPIDRNFVADFQETTGPTPKEFMEIIISESMKVPARIWKAVLSELPEIDHGPILRRIYAPTLIAWGNQDGIFARRDQESLLNALPESNLKEYEAGHNIHWERPEEFAADLEEFLDRRL